jgi:hypothetical protein
MPFAVLAATDESRVQADGDGLDATAAGLTAAALRNCSPTLSVWPRNVSGLFPASTGRRCVSTPPATRYGMRAERCARSWSSSGVDRQSDGQLMPSRCGHSQGREIAAAAPSPRRTAI